MSLVPIIYTSLALFFGLLIIVLLISYLTYKTRRNTNPVIIEEINKHKKLDSPPTIIVRRNDNLQSHSIRKIDSEKHHIPNVQNTPLILPHNYFREEQIIRKSQPKEIENQTKINYEKRRNTYLYNSRMQTRIEIMNENKKFQRQEENNFSKNSIARSINDLSQFNIFSFYSDNNREQDFVTATAVPHHP